MVTTTTTTTTRATSTKISTTKRRTSTGSSSSSRFIPRATNATDAGGKVKPDWAGEENFLSKVVDAAISNELLYEKIMKPMARRTLINTAEKNGIAWRDEAARLEANKAVYDAYESIKREEEALRR